MLRGPVSSSSTHAVSASADGSTVPKPPQAACRTTAGMVRALRGLHEKQVREAADVDAVQRAHAVSPVLRQGETVAAGHLEAGPPRVRGADLEAGAVDDAVELVLPAGHDHPGRGDPRHPLPSVST